jgi:hypothetical protein
MENVETPRSLSCEQLGRSFMASVLHRQRVLESIDRVLGRDFSLGPIGAGPGRALAKITAQGTFGPTYGEELEDTFGFQVFLPVSVTFDLDLRVDSMSFDADVVVPLTIQMHMEEPLTLVLDIRPPTADEVTMSVRADKRRSAAVRRMAALDSELRRFIVRYVTRELEKPHVRKATRIDLVAVIDGAWPEISRQFLPA